MMRAIAKGNPFMGWYGVSHDGGPDMLGMDALMDTSVTYTYSEVEEGVDRVMAHINEKGPVDVLVGFSQGCIVSHLIAATLRQRGEPIPWRISVLFCGMRVRD